MNLSKIFWTSFFVFLIWWAAKDPTAAAHAVHSLSAFLSQAADGLGKFVGQL